MVYDYKKHYKLILLLLYYNRLDSRTLSIRLTASAPTFNKLLI